MNDVVGSEEIVSKENASSPHTLAFVALLLGNVALATGPFLVRNSDVGPIAAGYWRLALAIPFLWAVAVAVKQPIHWPLASA